MAFYPTTGAPDAGQQHGIGPYNDPYHYQQNQTQRAIPQPTIMYDILSTLLAPTARGFSSTCTQPLHDYGNRSGRTR